MTDASANKYRLHPEQRRGDRPTIQEYRAIRIRNGPDGVQGEGVGKCAILGPVLVDRPMGVDRGVA